MLRWREDKRLLIVGKFYRAGISAMNGTDDRDRVIGKAARIDGSRVGNADRSLRIYLNRSADRIRSEHSVRIDRPCTGKAREKYEDKKDSEKSVFSHKNLGKLNIYSLHCHSHMSG